MTTLGELYREIEACNRCDLFKGRTRVVPGEGPEDAEIVFIGEAPGWNEDQQGRPFVGAAGQYLESLLSKINLTRDQVYITNVVKDRPPGNRDPLPVEITACNMWLDRQIEIIQPKMIVTLGRYSLAKFFPGKSISRVHGAAEKRDNVIYYPMYHPAAALHQQSLRNVIEEDILKIPLLLSQIDKVAEKQEEPKQLNMFE